MKIENFERIELAQEETAILNDFNELLFEIYHRSAPGGKLKKLTDKMIDDLAILQDEFT